MLFSEVRYLENIWARAEECYLTMLLELRMSKIAILSPMHEECMEESLKQITFHM